jgi:hypothetical protein
MTLSAQLAPRIQSVLNSFTGKNYRLQISFWKARSIRFACRAHTVALAYKNVCLAIILSDLEIAASGLAVFICEVLAYLVQR